jgi:hypothetical protein
MEQEKEKRVGRPVGYVMSAQSKGKIAVSKTGQRHSETTRLAIAEGVRTRRTELTVEDISKLSYDDIARLVRYKRGKYYAVNIWSSKLGRSVKILKHVAVAVKKYGRFPTPDEHVHHINLNPFDNTPENLIIVPMREHRAIHRLVNKVLIYGITRESLLEMYDNAVNQIFQPFNDLL